MKYNTKDINLAKGGMVNSFEDPKMCLYYILRWIIFDKGLYFATHVEMLNTLILLVSELNPPVKEKLN